MVLLSTNPWETTTRSALIPTGTHKLHISTSGPPRKPHHPVLIMFTGAGAPAIAYLRLQRLLSKHYRVYFPDRSGYDHSERDPVNQHPTAQHAASDLAKVLKAIDVRPPYVLIGNSYGAIVARAFLDLLGPGEVTGMLLAEAGTELMYHLWQRIPDKALDSVAEGVDFIELTDLRRESGFTDEEFEAVIEAIVRTQAGAEEEENHGSAFALAQARQFERRAMGEWPVSVVRCDFAKNYRILFEEGVRRGQGTEEQREAVRAFIRSVETFDDELRASQLRLSSQHRYVRWVEHGHDDILRRPEVYIDEVRWIMEHQHRNPP